MKRHSLRFALAVAGLVAASPLACSTTFTAVAPRDGGVADSATDARDAAAFDRADAAAEDDAEAADAAPIVCDLSKPFNAPRALTALNTAGDDGTPRLSADELSIYFQSNSRGGADSGGTYGIFVATRASTAASFDAPTPVASIDLGSNVYDATLSPDQLTLLYQHAGATSQIYAATRTTPLLAFGAGSARADLSSINNDGAPYFAGAGDALWFDSDRSPSLGGYDLYRAPNVGSTFGAPVVATELNSPNDDWVPTPSFDELTIFWASTRTDGAAHGGFDIWMATRASTTLTFSGVTSATDPNLNSASNDYPAWLSKDGCRLYMTSDRPGGAGGNDLYVAERPNL